MLGRPSLLVTLDTEPDDLWRQPRAGTVRNAHFLPRFQALCERHGVRPVYLTDYVMGQDPVFIELARDVLARDAGELGMHLHAWNTPPFDHAIDQAAVGQPYLTDYPASVMAEKVKRVTDLLRGTFGDVVTSHRAGRWAFNSDYARLLVAHGYRVDSSVTPLVRWPASGGAGPHSAGLDYRQAPTGEYPLDLERVLTPGASGLLEIPVTIRPTRSGWSPLLHRLAPGPLRRVARRLSPELLWLRPNGWNGAALPRLVDRVLAEGSRYVQLMLHSSELMPGGSPTFGSARAIERLYVDLERVLAHAAARCAGRTLAEHAAWVAAESASEVVHA